MDIKTVFKLSAMIFGLTLSKSASAEDKSSPAKPAAPIVVPSSVQTGVQEVGLIRGPKTDKVAVSEIIFKDQLVIHDKGLSKDGGPMENVPCDAEVGGVTFGFIKLDEKTTAELNCIDDYAGGISIVIKGAKGSAVSEKLGEVLGDAGESTETRSWILKKEGVVTIQTVTYSSYQDPDAEDTAPVNCDKKAWTLDYDKKSKKFKRKSLALTEKDLKFVPAARVAEKCAL